MKRSVHYDVFIDMIGNWPYLFKRFHTGNSAGLVIVEEDFMFVWQYHPMMLPFGVSLLVSLGLLYVGWQRRRVPGAVAFMALTTAVAVYTLGYMLELGSLNVPTITLFAKFEFIGVAFMPVAWLTLALVFTRPDTPLSRRQLVALCLIPIVTVLMAWTNEWHGLMWQTIGLDRTYGFASWQATYGLWYVVHIVYFQLLTFTGIFLLFSNITHSPTLYRRQVGMILASQLVPWVVNALYFSRLLRLPFNPTAFALAVGGLFIAWAVFRFQFLDLVPVARNVVIDTMSDGVLVLDQHNRIVDFNRAAQAISGRPHSLIGWEITAVWPEFRTLLALNPEADSLETELARPLAGKGSTSFAVRVTPLLDRRQHLHGRVVTLVDITERKEVEDALRAAKEAAEKASRETEMASLAKSAFLRNVSHELRTPLTVVSLYTEILQKLAHNKGYDELTPRLEQIHSAARHLSHVVNDILDLSKIEAGAIDLQEELFDVRLLLAELAEMAQPLVTKNDNTFQLNVADDLGYVYTDPTKLRQILLNLLSNAAKFTAAGEIKLNVTRRPSRFEQGLETIRFELQDTGIGMTPEQAAEIFEPFTQLDNSHARKYEGTGLGLTISRHYCHMMDGELTVHSEPQKGSVFTVEIPVRLPAPRGVRAVPN